MTLTADEAQGPRAVHEGAAMEGDSEGNRPEKGGPRKYGGNPEQHVEDGARRGRVCSDRIDVEPQGPKQAPVGGVEGTRVKEGDDSGTLNKVDCKTHEVLARIRLALVPASKGEKADQLSSEHDFSR